jgi:predicted HTH domain antitoxin
MSDSDCSNCDKETCSYRDVSYNCYLKEIKAIKEKMTLKHLISITIAVDTAEFLYHETDNDIFSRFAELGSRIIEAFNEELPKEIE